MESSDTLKKLTSGKLQDIESWIKMVEKEKTKGILYKSINRIFVPFAWNKSTNEWLEVLYFLKKQETEYLEFINNIKEKHKQIKLKNE